MTNNLILIGMPGAGKSTVGVLLAKQFGLDFIDTDLLLQRQEGMRLQQVITLKGLDSFRKAEEQMLLALNCENTVIATGGSVIYSEPGMAHLKTLGKRIYLHISLPQLTQRIADMGERGILMARGQSFADLYDERTPLYSRYADLDVPIDDLGVEEVLKKIEKQLPKEFLF
jgi:shikimate kinase